MIFSIQRSHHAAPLFSFTAIYNFQGNGAPQLSLQIGDVVRIQETCGGESLVQVIYGCQTPLLMVLGHLQLYLVPPALSWNLELCVVC